MTRRAQAGEEASAETGQSWRERRLIPAIYDLVVGNPTAARLGGRLLWDTDVRLLYAAFHETAGLPAGSRVLDVPCGGGVALRGIPPATALRYVAADLSAVMLARARAEAARRGPAPGPRAGPGTGLEIGFVRVSADHLPFGPGVFDRCVSYNGLHCFADPAPAVAEMARVLRTGGTLAGSVVVSGAGARQDVLIRLFRRAGLFGPTGSLADVREWLEGAGLTSIEVTASGALAWFRAVKP